MVRHFVVKIVQRFICNLCKDNMYVLNVLFIYLFIKIICDNNELYIMCIIYLYFVKLCLIKFNQII